MNNNEYADKIYEQSSNNVNELPYWYEKIKNVRAFRIPETQIIEIPKEIYIQNECYCSANEEGIKALQEYIKSKLDKKWEGKKLFIKSGLFSNKFVFMFCRVEANEHDKIAEKFVNIQNGALCLGCPVSKYLVVREFIETKQERESIYFGMKLNTEFRVFYDFDKKEFIDIVNYWDRYYVGEQLMGEDKILYDKSIGQEEKEYYDLNWRVVEYCEANLKHIEGLTGKWSVDFMWDGENFWLIDMALAENSAYWDEICKKRNKID